MSNDYKDFYMILVKERIKKLVQRFGGYGGAWLTTNDADQLYLVSNWQYCFLIQYGIEVINDSY